MLNVGYNKDLQTLDIIAGLFIFFFPEERVDVT
ncbi:MAG: hypothetical protein UV52_C0022G0005 [Parcubacteria group bacterium GW2011_GWD1_42_9]|nr:MAG: hypothetical protein UV52_C0022G0005 [Parcubacteria group bacterium GW2011_GWD1_42_9]KKT12919.1 MAG: hypothetical protein UV92_C0020G0005 [Parcubacteria group bacterium GW2011_GWA1_43_27]KKT14348.1 MAG: hypothetical protein UV96_C0034G0005 [Parcubacteria group bacterium GW2011_GWF2_43_38]KKT22864.1 MAG: hypothetical protein UW06_C0004G0032 [Parcubacteria group bacterium GW2011_GWE1_43_8]KKT28127.1 MAG: hypothetical protein UW12_C0007G0008 [Parcubacteria group bacterium GW2011_GWF1_43_9]